MMVTSIRTEGGMEVGAPQRLFQIDAGYVISEVGNTFDVDPDDERFLMGRYYSGNAEDSQTSLVVVENFFEVLREQVPR